MPGRSRISPRRSTPASFGIWPRSIPQNQRKDTLSADFNLTDKQRVQFRRMNFAFWEYQPLDGGTDETPKYFNRPNQTNSLSHVWTVSANKVNEILATVSLDDVYIPVDQANFLDRTNGRHQLSVHLPGRQADPHPHSDRQHDQLLRTERRSVSVSLLGSDLHDFRQLHLDQGQPHVQVRLQLREVGRERQRRNQRFSACPTCTNNQNGQFAFTDTRSGRPTTGNAAANAALGLFDTYSELGQRAYTIFRGNMYEAFAQDSWKVSQKLHVDYGVRYSIIIPMEALWRNMSAFDPKFYDPAKAVKIDPTTGLVIAGLGRPVQRHGDSRRRLAGFGQGPLPGSQRRQPELPVPRRAEALSPTPSTRTSSRASASLIRSRRRPFSAPAIGRFFTRLGVSDSIFLGGNPPFQPTANVSFGSADNPGGTSANAPAADRDHAEQGFQESGSLDLECHLRAPDLLEFGVLGRLCGAPRPAPAARSQHQPAHAGSGCRQPGRQPRRAASLQGLQLDPRRRTTSRARCTTRSS